MTRQVSRQEERLVILCCPVPRSFCASFPGWHPGVGLQVSLNLNRLDVEFTSPSKSHRSHLDDVVRWGRRCGGFRFISSRHSTANGDWFVHCKLRFRRKISVSQSTTLLAPQLPQGRNPLSGAHSNEHTNQSKRQHTGHGRIALFFPVNCSGYLQPRKRPRALPRAKSCDAIHPNMTTRSSTLHVISGYPPKYLGIWVDR